MHLLADFITTHLPVSPPTHLTSYVPEETALSTTPVVLETLMAYLAIIFGVKALMTNKRPLNLTRLFQTHNSICSLGSTILLVLMLEEIAPIICKEGLYSALCAEKSWTKRLEFYYMINYYFKYLELLDTVFLAFKKKPIQFLHVFHHFATALLCYWQMNDRPSGAWAVIIPNLAVHVVMYYYFYATTRGAKLWWKKYLTLLQIIQFVMDLALVYFEAYSHLAVMYFPDTLPYIDKCAAGKGAAGEGSFVFSCVLFTIYLGLFVSFYIQTYNKPTAAIKGVVDDVQNGQLEGKQSNSCLQT
ncbi:GNS1/SUR4 membrane protein [Lyophyllum atratum]|nr:GNS1/SUR4 membrane protein [Lyophyllum atratum]